MSNKRLISLRAWARSISLLKTLDGLRRCRGLSKYKLLISCDHYNPMVAQQLLEAVELSQIAEAIETELIFHDDHVGCTGNFRYVLERSFSNNEDWAVFMEDDTYPAIDILEYFEQTAHLLDDYFASCTLHRPCHELIAPTPSATHKLVSKEWFEGANVFALGKKTYDKIQEKGGIFGISSQNEKAKLHHIRNGDWVVNVTIDDKFGWDTPMEKYFRDLPCLYPVVGRTLNIGKSGLHLNFNQYMELQYNENWAHNPYYINKIMETTWFDLEVRKDDTVYLEDGIYYA